jgi:hypothetical protein
MQATLMMGMTTGPHVNNIIKQADQTETNGAGAIPIAQDDELFFTARANTLYEIRCGVHATSTGVANTGARFRLRCSVPVTHAALRLTRMTGDIADGWPSGTNLHRVFCWTTVQFNDDDRNFNLSTNTVFETGVIYGIIKTSGTGVISLHWGSTSGNGSLTVLSGSWLSAVEGEEV